MIWDEEHECMSREEVANIQLGRLKTTVARVYEKVPFYRKAFEERGIKPEDIRTLKDLERLPFTTKDDLRDWFPYGMFAVPMRDVVRVHSSSGTTGIPTVVGYTKQDMETWTDLVARMICQAGVTPDDIVQISFGYGLFTGGFGLHYGMERVGATVIPVSSGNTERQIRIMRDFGTTALVSTPTYALHMAEVAQEMGIDPKKDLKVRVGLFGGERLLESARNEIEEKWGMLATDNYGLSEVMGPGISGECTLRCGLHIAEDHFIAEIIDPDTGEVLPYGEEGELVLTAITKEALPIIRFRTKDISRLEVEPCKCGRTSMRMAKIRARTDDMLIIRGVNIFPSQIEEILNGMDGISPYYQIIVDKKGYLDEIEVKIEISESLFSDRFKDLEALEKRLKARFFTALGIHVKVKLVEPKTIERTAGKTRRVFDKRPKA
jgi:phenylacetate-CoA ligase